MTTKLQERQTIDSTVADVRSQYIPESREYMPQTKRYKPAEKDISQDYVKSMKAKFLDWYFGLPKKGDPRRKEYLAIFSN
ncbi:hypothetical protein KY343_04690 [Candidatus Woesearchaeota archaeon]|nr:hypothetical protein [Candidatus Woesearchaeota archaeon]